MDKQEEALKVAAEVLAAWEAWRKAPMHVKAMAGPYVEPIFTALWAMSRAVEVLARPERD